MAKKKNKRRRKQIELPENLIGSLAAIAVVLCCFWRVGPTNLYGDMGSAYYAAALDWYILLFIPVGIGMFGAVSSMVLSRLERGSVKGARRVVRTAAFGGAAASLFLMLIGFVCSDLFLGKVMGLPEAVLAFKGFLPALLPMSVFLSLAGGMDGFGSERSVNLVRLLFCLLLFGTGAVFTAPLLEYGQKVGALLQNSQYGPAFGALGGALNLLAAAVVTMVATGILWWNLRPAVAGLERTEETGVESQNQILKGIFAKSLPVMLPSLLIMLGMIGQNLMFFGTAQEDGFQDTVLIWGIFAGKTRALLTVPVIFAACFGAHMLPELKLGYLSRNLKRTREKCMITLRCMALLTMPAAVLFAVCAQAVIGAFYKTGEMEQAVGLLRIGSIAVVFYGLAIALFAILMSADFVMSVIVDTLISTVLHLAALFVMLHFLELGIYAVVYANIILAVALCFSYFYSIQRQMKIRISWIRIFLAPCVGGAAMAAVCALLTFAVLKNAASTVNALVCALVGFAVYFVAVVLLKGATRRELLAFWGGERIVAIARLLRLM